MNYLVLVKAKLGSASKLLERYHKMVGSLYRNHKVEVEEKDEMLEELIHPHKLTNLGKMLEKETVGKYNSSGAGTSGKTTKVGSSRYSPTPEPIHYPMIDSTDKDPYDPFDIVESSTPIENYDGWRYDWYTGTSSQPISEFSWLEVRLVHWYQ